MVASLAARRSLSFDSQRRPVANNREIQPRRDLFNAFEDDALLLVPGAEAFDEFNCGVPVRHFLTIAADPSGDPLR